MSLFHKFHSIVIWLVNWQCGQSFWGHWLDLVITDDSPCDDMTDCQNAEIPSLRANKSKPITSAKLAFTLAFIFSLETEIKVTTKLPFLASEKMTGCQTFIDNN